MTGNIFSADFFKHIAMSKADMNKNTYIDEEEYEIKGRKVNEKSVFEAEYKKFDMNNDGVVDDKDVPLFKKSIGETPEDKKREQDLADFKRQHPNFNPLTASPEEIEEFKTIVSSSLLEQRMANSSYKEDVESAYNYLEDTNNYEVNRYEHPYKKYLNINSVDEKQYAKAYANMSVLNKWISEEKNPFSVDNANDLANHVINTADKATNDITIQEMALSSLKKLANSGADLGELIEDVKNNIRAIKTNFEQELQSAKSDKDKHALQETISNMNKMLE